jgi:hypothetical protein
MRALSLLLLPTACSQTYYSLTSTIAGGATGSSDGAGSAASFFNPRGIASSGNGTFYVADTSNHRIRAVTPTGLVTTIAGSSNCNSGPSDGIGTAAGFCYPWGVAIDFSSGSLVVADSGYNRIKRITSILVVTTLAGRAAAGNSSAGYADALIGANALFNSPSFLTVDASGNIFVSDTGNVAIRTVSPLGVVGTLVKREAQGNSAQLGPPAGIALDPAAAGVYVITSTQLLRVTPNGIVFKVCGGAAPGFADGEGTAAQFNAPRQLLVFASGASVVAYIADTGNNRLRYVDLSAATAKAFTLVGNGTPGGMDGVPATLVAPSGVASDGTGGVYVTEGSPNGNRIRRSILLPCPPGFACPAVNVAPTPCAAGSVAPAGGVCAPCAAGTYAPAAGAATCTQCMPGTWSAAVGAVSAATCSPCGANTANPAAGAGTPSACAPCSAGNFSSAGAGVCCAPGAWAAPGALTCTPCAPGSFSAAQGATSIVSCASSCTPNTFSLWGAAACAACGGGLFSGAGAAVCCPLGAWAAPGDLTCTPCAAGKYSGLAGAATEASCTACPAGAYCPLGAASPSLCPANTMNPLPGRQSADACMACGTGSGSDPGARVCVAVGAGSSCAVGFFVNASANTGCSPCPAGTFSSNTSAASAAACAPCDVGSFSGVGASACQACAAGAYCVGGRALLCPAGRFNGAQGSDSEADCAPCPAGTYSPLPGASSPTLCAPCPAGAFSAASGAAACSLCPPGTASPTIAATSAFVCTPCSVGFFAPSAGNGPTCPYTCDAGYRGLLTGGVNVSHACALCAPGFFSPAPASQRCTACAAGSFSAGAGAPFCDECPAGYFSNAPAATSLGACAPCPAGSYNGVPGQTQVACLPCPGGTASGAAGATAAAACTPCAPGTWAAAGSPTCTSTPAGAFSTAGAVAPTACPPGTFGAAPNGASAESCAPCAPGTASAAPGATGCTACAVGTYSNASGATSCTPCPAGFFNNAPGAVSAGACAACPAGSFNPVPGQTAAACIQCSPGTASGAVGAADAAACTPCAAGSFAGAGAAFCRDAPPGTYALAGAAAPTDCALGTFLPASRGASAAACTPCPAGTTTAATGATTPSQCLAGVFACALGQQPRSAAAPGSAADCVPLVCAPPLLSAAAVTANGTVVTPAGAAADAAAAAASAACAGCEPGTAGAPGACAPCGAGDLCPGLLSHPLLNFSDFSAAPRAPAASGGGGRALAVQASPWGACPALTASLSASAAAGGAGVPLLPGFSPSRAQLAAAAGGLAFAAGLMGGLLALRARGRRGPGARPSLTARAFRALDMYDLHHYTLSGLSPVKVATTAGGVFTVLAFTVVGTFAAYMVLQWQDSNTLVQRSLEALDGGAWARARALPWASSPLPAVGAPPSGAPATGLLLRLTLDGEPGACAAPLVPPASLGLSRGAWTLAANVTNCGGSCASQHTYACVGCELGPGSALSLLFHYSCQSLMLEAAAVPAYPAGATSTMSEAVAPAPGAPAAALTWTLSTQLTLAADNSGGGASARGYAFTLTSLARAAPPLPRAPAASGGFLLVRPAEASLNLTIATPLATTFTTTSLTTLVPWTQLLANIVGLSGVLTVVGVLFQGTERCCDGGAAALQLQGAAQKAATKMVENPIAPVHATVRSVILGRTWAKKS